ncbi:hypothetical protein KI387_034052, partial [Taxus chinensis]
MVPQRSQIKCNPKQHRKDQKSKRWCHICRTNTHDTDHYWYNSLKQGSSSQQAHQGAKDFQNSKRRPRWRKHKGHLAAQEDDESDEETSEGAHC